MSRAAEYRLKAMLSEADLATDADIRARVATELRPLAIALGRERMLEDFTTGKPVATPARLRKLANAASVMDAQMRTVGDQFIRLGRS